MQRCPDEEAALRCGPVCLPAEVLLQGLEHRVAAAAVEVLELLQVLAPIALGEVGRHEQLRHRRGTEVGALLAQIELLQDGPGRYRPPQAQSGGEDLGEGAEVDDEVRGSCAARAGGVQRVKRWQRLALVAQEPVGIVLQHQQLALARDLHQAASARQGHRHPAGVVEVGDGVDELRALALRLEAVEQRLQLVDRHAFAIHLDLHHLRLVGAEGGYRTGVGGCLSDDHVAGVDERLAHQVDHLLTAGGHDQILGIHSGALGGHHLDDALHRRRHAFGGPILQGARRGLGGDVGHQLRVYLGGERRGVGQTPGQRDHLRPFGQSHHLAHRRAAHPPRTLGEQPLIARQLVRRGAGRAGWAGPSPPVVYRHDAPHGSARPSGGATA